MTPCGLPMWVFMPLITVQLLSLIIIKFKHFFFKENVIFIIYSFKQETLKKCLFFGINN